MYEGSSVYMVYIYMREEVWQKLWICIKDFSCLVFIPKSSVYTAVINILCPPMIQVKNT